MDIIQLLQTELDYEVAATRKMLERVPAGQWDYKPHPKSMDMKALTTHLVDVPSWIAMGLNTTELDFAAQPYQPTEVDQPSELLDLLEKSYNKSKEALSKATEADLLPTWTLRTGDQIHAVMNKYELSRHALNQVTHHRAQLGVYLRLLNIPIPGSYGPSADDMGM